MELLREADKSTRAERADAAEAAVFGGGNPRVAWHKNGYLEACNEMLDRILNGGE